MARTRSQPHLSALCALASLALAASGCGLSRTDRLALSRYQELAQHYYGGGQLAQSWDQVQRGLEIQPDDYKLQKVAGWIRLRQAEVRPELLDDAAGWFAKLEQQRRRRDHSREFFLGNGRVHLMLAQRVLRRAELLEREAEATGLSESERAQKLAKVAENRESIAPRHLATARDSLEELVERTELPRLAHYHLVHVHVLYEGITTSDSKARAEHHASIEKHALACTDRILKLKSRNADLLESTATSASQEANIRDENAELDDMELRVRTTLSALYYDDSDFHKSISQLDLMLTIDPSRAFDYYNRARAYRRLGDKERAKWNYDRFLSRTRRPPGDTLVEEAVEFIARLEVERKLGRLPEGHGR